MKNWMVTGVLLVALLLAGCASKIYGVPEERWETMTEQERIAAMEAYKARQEVLRQKRAEQARLRAMEKEAQLAREAEEARLRQRKVDAIYRGEGLYGDLLRVNLEGGMLKFYGAHRPYHQVAFKIATGEVKEIEIVNLRGQKAHMVVSYDGSNLLLDETLNSHHSMALRLAYEDSWEDGAVYPGLSAKGPLQMKNVNATVKIIGTPPHRHYGSQRRPQVVVVRPPTPRPPTPAPIVVRAPEQQGKPQLSETGKYPHQKQPEATVLKPPARIRVVFRKGMLKINKKGIPLESQLESQSIDLSHGQVRNVTIRSRHGNLKIRISYLYGEVLIDDAPGRGKNKTRLGFVPEWKVGQPYTIEASEHRKMEDLDIFILSI
jgi:hypothetical protein